MSELNGNREYQDEIAKIHFRLDGLERVIEKGLTKLSTSIELLTEAISGFGSIQKDIIFKIVNWLMFTFSIVVLTLLGLKLGDAELLKLLLGLR
jgi:hypothetical protein